MGQLRTANKRHNRSTRREIAARTATVPHPVTMPAASADDTDTAA